MIGYCENFIKTEKSSKEIPCAKVRDNILICPCCGYQTYYDERCFPNTAGDEIITCPACAQKFYIPCMENKQEHIKDKSKTHAYSYERIEKNATSMLSDAIGRGRVSIAVASVIASWDNEKQNSFFKKIGDKKITLTDVNAFQETL